MADDFPIPFAQFAQMLSGTHDEVWTTLLKQRYGRENHVESEWRALLDAARNEPAHPGP
jgi:hypothetical protein